VFTEAPPGRPSFPVARFGLHFTAEEDASTHLVAWNQGQVKVPLRLNFMLAREIQAWHPTRPCKDRAALQKSAVTVLLAAVEDNEAERGGAV
jgi:hypothetical protein